MYTYDIRSVVGVYTPVGVATEWLWSVHSKLECTLRQGKGGLSVFQCSSERTRGPRLWWQQMRAMSSKRLWGFVRSWPMTLGKLIVPMLVTSLGIALNKTFPSPRDSPPLVLDVAGCV